MEQDISLQDILGSSFANQMSNIYTSIPCTVLAVYDNGNSSKVDVQPLINTLYRDETDEQHPPILAVPLIFPCSSTSAFTFPVNVGDGVVCLFSQRGLDNFKQGSGTPTKPTDYRKFDKRDAMAIPGIFPFSKAATQPSLRKMNHSNSDAVIAHNLGTGNEVEVRLKANGDLVINTSAKNVYVNTDKAIINAQSGEFNIANTVWNGNMTFNGNLTQVGTYVLSGVNMNNHVHSGVQSGSSKTLKPE